MKKLILITGSNGQLGNECRVLSETYPKYNFLFVSKQDLSIDNITAVEDLFSNNNIDYCINCAAFTAVDLAETEIETAYNINATAVGNLAKCCQKYNARLIHISTDYVFNGEKKIGYLETDTTGPINVYGASKLEGEKIALTENPASIIIRTSWVYSSFGKNFVKTMMRLMQEKTEINVVSDQIGKPTYAHDLAKVIFDIIEKEEKVIPGIYHYANEGIISWYEFAQEIKNIANYSCKINPISSASYIVPAKRPHYSILNTDKIVLNFGIKIPEWKDSLQKCMSLLK